MKTLLSILVLLFASSAFGQAIQTDTANLLNSIERPTWGKDVSIVNEIAPGIGQSVVIKLPFTKKTAMEVAKPAVDSVKEKVLSMLNEKGYTKEPILLRVIAFYTTKTSQAVGEPYYQTTPIRIYTTHIGFISTTTIYGGDVRRIQPSENVKIENLIAAASWDNFAAFMKTPAVATRPASSPTCDPICQ